MVEKNKIPRGTKRSFVAERLQLSNQQIATEAAAAGMQMTPDAVSQHRLELKKKKAKAAPGKTKKAKAAVVSDMPQKESQLRRLIFELGFDAARNVFQEFEELHTRMR